ncbi:molybdenum cofactor guanylyltransferase [Cyanobium sp. CH-040]|uniref:molybdenum cofactor guanylyltransferase n=1 Tax=Cyanobium sp. CH-040 TaxID=2823708 RepID=UPI0020CBDF89|nr:molybdenum cofactor guanylyltransferase [Cyanobium sp. CH-040]MCP9928374.1 molybdenum cofactor guanylyltransferase [Cyanobium sp. CH-040]
MTQLRCCLLSGGDSRRMGRDKALLPHPEGGSWLERTLGLLVELGAPVTLLSRHPAHLALARGLTVQRGEAQAGAAAAHITPIAEPPPWEGPLLALHRLMERHPQSRLLLCPVDMPWLSLETLRALVAAADAVGREVDGEAPIIHLAHDGQRLQPLLGIYPSSAPIRAQLAAAIHRGERGLQRWLAGQACRPVHLDPQALRNVNRPQEFESRDDPKQGSVAGSERS